MTAECKVPAAAVDVPTEGGCGVSGPFDYEYANAACHESKARKRQGGREQSERKRESERKKEGNGLKDRQGVVGKREVKCFHISFECALCISLGSFQALE